MNRRGFLRTLGQGTLLVAVAPAIVRVESLMKLPARGGLILWGDSIHDDTLALQALIDRQKVLIANTFLVPQPGVLIGGSFLVSDTLLINRPVTFINNHFLVTHERTPLHDISPPDSMSIYQGTHIEHLTLEGKHWYASHT